MQSTKKSQAEWFAHTDQWATSSLTQWVSQIASSQKERP
jgi:hypothetical protein